MVEITMRGWGNSTIYRVILAFCFYCVVLTTVMGRREVLVHQS